MEEETGWDWKPSFAKRQNKNKTKQGATAPWKCSGLVSAASSARKTASALPVAFPVNEGRRGDPHCLSPFSDRDPEKRGQRKVGQVGKTLKRS